MKLETNAHEGSGYLEQRNLLTNIRTGPRQPDGFHLHVTRRISRGQFVVRGRLGLVDDQAVPANRDRTRKFE